MAYPCPHPCDGKTEYGYCRYTWCINPLHSNFGTAYQGQGVQKRIITNADRIRAMTDEELAEFINDVWDRLLFGNDLPGMCDVCYTDTIQNCKKCWLDWLKEEAVSDG